MHKPIRTAHWRLIAAFTLAAPAAAQDDAPVETTEELTLDDAPASFWQGWDGSVEFGVDGSSGNDESFDLRAGLRLERDTERYLTKFSATYMLETDDGEENENNLTLKAGHDWKLPDSRWRIFTRGLYEYDEFEDWDSRVRLGGGLGYDLIDTERTRFTPRVGLFVHREFGGEDDDWTPELNLGFDFEHELSETADIYWTFDYYPALDDFADYWIETEAGIKVAISEDHGLYLRAGIEDEYDSRPGSGKKRNDLDYFLVLGYEF